MPEADIFFLDNAFAEIGDNEVIAFPLYLQILSELREYLELEERESLKKKTVTGECNSVQLLKERNKRHIRYSKAPNEKQCIPLTMSQEVNSSFRH